MSALEVMAWRGFFRAQPRPFPHVVNTRELRD